MLVVSLKAGGFGTGNYKIKMSIFKPDAQTPIAGIENRAFFEGGPDHGANIVSPLLLLADEEGLWWIDVLFEDRLITRVPLRVIFAEVPALPPHSPERS